MKSKVEEIPWYKTKHGTEHAESCECHTDHQKYLKYRVCKGPRCKGGECEGGEDFGFHSVGAGYSRRIYRCEICGHRFLSRKSV